MMARITDSSEVSLIVWNGSLFDEDSSLVSGDKIDAKGFDGRLINQGKALQNQWVDDFTIYTRGTVPVDYFLAGGFYDVISDPVRRTIQGTTEKERVEFLPARVISLDTGKEYENYWIMNVIESRDALNWEKTIWTTPKIPYNDKQAYSKIIRPTFTWDLIKNVNIFHLSIAGRIKSGIYISRRLKEKLEETGCTYGMQFTPIKIS
jgi:hypothetical protein